MGKPYVFDLEDLNGGLNESAPESIGDREASTLENLYVDGSGLTQAPGKVALSTAYTERINSIARYNPSFLDEEFTILGCASSVARLVGTTITTIDVADGRIYPTLDYRWWFRQYNDEMFACQRGNGGVKRIYGDSIMEAGIPAPATAPLVIDGGAGQKTTGEYAIAISYYNTVTGAESNLSSPSKPITIADNHSLAVSAIPVSPSQQVTARRIYCTLPDDLGSYYLVGQIDDNVTTTYLENAKPPDEYGAAHDGAKGLPPPQAYALEIYKERLFVVDKDGFYWSEAAAPQNFKATNYYPIAKGSGYYTTGLKFWEDHGLIIMAQDKPYILKGNTPSDWTVEVLAEAHGSPAGQSITVGDGVCYWYTGVNFVRSGGTSAEILPGIERIRDTLDDIPEAQKFDVQGDTIPSKGWVVWTVPTSAGTRKIVVYDYRKDAFTVLTGAPDTIKRFVRDDQTEVLLAAFDATDILYEYLTGTAGMGTAKWRSKAFRHGTDGVGGIVRRVSIDCPRTNTTVTIRVINDINGTVVTSRNVSLYRHGWKRFGVATTPGKFFQIEIEHSGTVPLVLNKLQIEGVTLGRRETTL